MSAVGAAFSAAAFTVDAFAVVVDAFVVDAFAVDVFAAGDFAAAVLLALVVLLVAGCFAADFLTAGFFAAGRFAVVSAVDTSSVLDFFDVGRFVDVFSCAVSVWSTWAVRSSGEAVTVLRYQRAAVRQGRRAINCPRMRGLPSNRRVVATLCVSCVVDHEMTTGTS